MILRLVTYLLTIAALALVGLYVYLNNRKNNVNIVFALFNLSIVAWITALAFADTSTSLTVVKIASQVAFAASGYIFLFLVYLSFVFPRNRKNLNKFKVVAFAILPILLSFFAPSSLAVESVSIESYGANVQGGSLYNVLGIFIGLYLIIGIYNLVRSFRHSHGIAREQIRFVLYGMVLTAVIGIGTNVVLVALGNSSLGFLGPPAVLILVSFTGYSMVRHKLFDIRALVARSVLYLLMVLLIGLIFGVAVFGIGGAVVGLDATLVQRIFILVLALFMAFIFQPLRRKLEKVTDQFFYKNKYDAQELINNVGRILAMEIELGPLSNKVISEITRQMRIDDADIVILDRDKVYYDAHSGQHEAYHVPELHKLGKAVIAVDDLQGGERKEILDKYGVAVSLALRTSEEFVGFLFVGRKLSGDIYTEADIKVLQIIANELAVGVQNAKAYNEIQQFNETLQAKVDDATKRLRHANDELKELDQAKDEFISMASHQLRTPLTTTKGYVSMVLEGDFGKPTRDMKEPLTQALDSANRMARMVSDLLNVSRMDAGKFFIDAHDSDLSKVVPEEVNGLQTLAGSRQVALTYHQPKHKIPTINLDEDKMRQVIMNLIDNSIHYSNATPGLGKTDVYLELEKKEVVFKVVDNGIGVPKAVQPKLFGKFFRAGNAQKTRPDGTGLGLYLVKRVVEDHGGKIIFESTEGKGSTFGFRMPLQTVIHNDPKAMKRLAAAQVSAGQ